MSFDAGPNRVSWRSIVVIVLCAAFLFFKYVVQTFPSIISDQLIAEFHLKATGLGNLAACFFYSYIIVQLFAGVLLDRFNYRFISAGAVLLAALGLLGFTLTDSLLTANFSRALMGAGTAFATIIYLKAGSTWFSARAYPVVAGLCASAAMSGAVFGQAPLSLLVQELSWRPALTYCAIAGCVLAVLMLIFLRSKKTDSGAAARLSFRQQIFLVVKNPQNWLLTFYNGLTLCPLIVFGGLWGTPFIENVNGLPHVTAALIVSLSFIGLGIGSPILGWLTGIFSIASVMFWSNILALVSLVAVLYGVNFPPVLLGTCTFLFGVGSGISILTFPLASRLNSVMVVATATAFVNTGDGLLDALTEPLIGKILDITNHHKVVLSTHSYTTTDYRIALFILPLYFVVALVLMKFMDFKTQVNR